MLIVDEFLTEKLHTNKQELIADAICCMKYVTYTKGELIVKLGEPISMYRFLATNGVVRGMEALIDNLNEMIGCMEYAKTEYENCQSGVNDGIAAIQLSGDY